MDYHFICPNCKKREIISMSMKEYTPDNHFCSDCNTELKRDMSNYGAISIDKTGTFCNKVSI